MPTTTKMPAPRPAAVARVAMAVPGTTFEWHRGSADVCGNPATIKRLDPGRLGATT